MKEFFTSLKEKWTNLSGAKKSVIVVAVLAIIISTVLFGLWLTRTEYAPLMTDLDSKTASAVTEKLKELKIEYKLDNQGTSVLVPKESVYDARIQLAGAGVLSETGLGFEIFDKTKLGVTDFERGVDYQRALQGELERTIAAFDEIQKARVHLVMPKESVFVEEEQPASAAITISLKPLAKLTQDQVKGIIYLVSSAVPNLPLENVKVIDATGRVLSDNFDFAKDSFSPQKNLEQFELKKTYEKDIEKRVQALLTRIYGEGNVVTMVTTELEFDHFEEKTTDYGDSSILGEETHSETSTSTNAGNAAGVDAQINNYGNATGGTSESTKDGETRNYKVDQNDTVTVRAPGQIRNTSVAVVVNGQLTPEQIAQTQDMVASAIGFNANRGDQINVSSMNFDAPAPPTDEVAAKTDLLASPWLRWLLIALGSLVVLFILWKVVRARRNKAIATDDRDIMEEIIEEELPVIPITPEAELEIIPEVTKKLSPEEKLKKERQEKLRDIVRDKPEEVAQLLKTWLTED